MCIQIDVLLVYSFRWSFSKSKDESIREHYCESLVGSHPNIELIGVLSENGTKVKEGIEPMFDMFLKEFGETAIFKQKFKVLHGKTSIEGYVEYMCCDDMQCLPPKEVKFKIGL